MDTTRTNIRIIAIGGGGNNVLNTMPAKDCKDVDCVAAHTDTQSLDCSAAKIKILLGKEITGGMGAGSNPKIGREAAFASRDEIRSTLKGSETVIILACLGGGTGTGGAPVVAEIAKEVGSKVIAVVSTPFTFEGKKRREEAEAGLAALKEKVDAIIVIHNQRILRSMREKVPLIEVFKEMDMVMSQVVSCLANVLSLSHPDDTMAYIKSALLSYGGVIDVGFGSAAGEDRLITALKKTMESPPLVDPSIRFSCGVLVCISGLAELCLSDINEVISTIQNEVCENARITFCTAFDKKLGDTVLITVMYIK